jgi:hypothetical protein
VAVVAALGSVITAPVVWALTPVFGFAVPALPIAGPLPEMFRPPWADAPLGRLLGADAELEERPPFLPGDARVDAEMVRFLLEHRGDTEFLVAGPSAMLVAPVIVATGEPAMALGGFSGVDPILTAEQFAQRVDEGQVRFVLAAWRPGLLGRFPGLPGRPGPSRRGDDVGADSARGMIAPFLREPPAMAWVREQCRPVDPSLWRSDGSASATTGTSPGRPSRWRPGPAGGLIMLYDCRPDDAGG